MSNVRPPDPTRNPKPASERVALSSPGNLRVDSSEGAQKALKHPDVSEYIIENSPLLIVRVQPDGQTLYANRTACRTSGHSFEEILATGWIELNYPGEKKNQIEQLMAAIELNRDVHDYELTITNNQNKDRTIRWHTVNLFSEKGEVLEIIGLGRDITEERAKELDSIQTANRLAEAQRVAKIGSWEIDLESSSIWWSEESYRIFGMQKTDKSKVDFEGFLAAIFAEDRDLVRTTYERTVNERLPFDVCYRIALEDQSIKYVHALGEHLYDETGKPLRSLGTVRDVTQQIDREIKLQKIEAEARELQEYNDHVVQNSPMFIVALHPNGEVKYVNDAGCNISGFSRQELVSKNFDEVIFPGEYYEQVKGLDSENRIRRRMTDCETTICRKDGQQRTISWTSVNRFDDLGKVKEVINVGVDVTTLKKSQQELEHLVHYDPLTALPNRYFLSLQLKLEIDSATNNGKPGALICVDIDKLKDINETAGHAIGDELLKRVATRLKRCMREEDTVARLSGDEFAILITDIEDLADVSHVVDKIKSAFCEKFETSSGEYTLNSSLGVSLFPKDGETVEELLKNADIAVRSAKDKGGDIEAYYTPELNTTTSRRIWLEKNLRNALEREELVLYFQPQVSLADGTLIGAETLLRWLHPEEGIISPGEFIPIAESSGLIIPIGDWVLNKACMQARAWADRGLSLNHLAVNVAGPQITRGDLVASCERALSASGLMPSVLELEVTEGFIMNDAENSIDILRRLQDLGIPMSIDDFGTGYSSLAYLKRLPIDKIKVDRSFIKDIPADKDDMAITKTIIALGENLGLKVIAEGVETEEQREFLLSLGCEFAQGFLFYKPMPADEFFASFMPSMNNVNDAGLISKPTVA